MLNVKKMLEIAWDDFKSDYKNAEKCEEIAKGRASFL
jgi:hypothetical protein